MNFSYRQDVVLMVRSLYFCMEAQWSELGKMYDISPAQQHILFILSSNKRVLTPSDISEIGCWHISTVTRLLKPLKQRGLISVEQDPKRAKYKKVTITPAGEELFGRIVETIKKNDFFPFEMNQLSEEDIDAFLQCGQRILDTNRGRAYRERIFNAKIEGVDYA
jgi:MarR family protease production transcriptional regulator HPr